MKIPTNPNFAWRHEESLIKPDSHSWAPPNEGDPPQSSNSPVVGFSYQSFFEEHFFVSLLRPSDVTEIQYQASLGKKLHAMTILQFADCHSEVVETFLADGKVTSEPFFGFTLPHVAMMHISAGNAALSGVICMHLVRQGNARQVFHESAKTLLDNGEIGHFYLEQVLPILDIAERVFQHQKLSQNLATKATSKQVKI